MGMFFHWDRKKAAQNVKKHGISFEEAKSVFADPYALVLPDEEHSDDELREIAIGYSRKESDVIGRLYRTGLSCYSSDKCKTRNPVGAPRL